MNLNPRTSAQRGGLTVCTLKRGITRSWLCMLMVIAGLGLVPHPAHAQASLHIEDLTWTEVRDALKAGKTTVIIPVGGIEQSGPHMTLGKHNVRVKVLAERIALALGNALVAPVIAYVPEGQVSPPTQHMRFVGTVSIPDDAFKAVVDGAARSFKQHGFTDVVMIGDHGGYQSLLESVATRLNHDWAKSTIHAHFIGTYYDAAQTPYNQALRDRGLTDAQIGTHAGAADTSLMLATDATLVRRDQLKSTRDAAAAKALGVSGDPGASTAALGQIGVDLIVSRTTAAIRQAVARSR
ncbi:MAG: creatininase family protein [Aquabacterium sp.]|nr:creatininase family protein [Aquabacterium sp.]